MNQRLLSNRLKSVASFLPKNAVFADIGSDHAYLPCFVCLNDIQAIAIAGEINEGPYQSAKRTVEELGLTERVQVRKGNGLEVVEQGEVGQVIVAGMGGSLISTILEQGKEKLKGTNRIITQPNVDALAIRKWFFNNDFKLVDELILEEDGHIYEILVADKGKEMVHYTNVNKQDEFLFGPFLLREKAVPFKQKWLSEKVKREQALNQMKKANVPDKAKIELFENEIKSIQEVLVND
ncbi:tRNA (adenine(22)-N(1))-methyltransferase TrmK [Aquibacillus halophilus]|uniref:tRNA (Adenine(22)-N(1))-methyltransferase TrmK n=1 Tax=Aquibacillus halophilus TaxID=930132 RepID=A0A6A8DGX2_9BACI|nr:tRNA (adenine(22)-N(1))-methyltransferase TrmK [Aquibacillus halophilus]MRH43099.1 tRNA (adenine(22)-N(1))-methyltransferase TrmK [Aquibacillus halophilus]